MKLKQDCKHYGKDASIVVISMIGRTLLLFFKQKINVLLLKIMKNKNKWFSYLIQPSTTLLQVHLFS